MRIIRLGEAIGENHTLLLTPLDTKRFGAAILLASATVGANTARPVLFHGTPIHPDAMGDFILPSQSTTLADYPSRKRINHGSVPAISTSNTLEFSVTRSLLHDRHPALEGKAFHLVLARIMNEAGTTHLFTTAEVLRTLDKSAAHGYVYGIHQPASTALPYTERTDQAEWRIPVQTRWDWSAQTNIHDLSPQLQVVDAPGDCAYAFINQVVASSSVNPSQLGSEAGLPIYSFGEWHDRNGRA